jgi:hypothetical protein
VSQNAIDAWLPPGVECERANRLETNQPKADGPKETINTERRRRMKRKFTLTGMCAAVLLLGAALSAQATYLQLNSVPAAANVTVVYPWDNSTDGTAPPRTVAFGVYNVSTYANATGGSPLDTWNSVCLSPGGTIVNRELVSKENFGQGAPGHLPNNWSPGGIYNAAYIYNMHIDEVGGSADKGVGLALAMLDALYDSTGMGKLSVAGAGIGVGNFQATAGVSANALSWYNSYIADVTTANINANHYYAGSVWRPVDLNGNDAKTGQDFITKGTAIPEPTTMLAGALLLIPFGASTLRMLRRRKA